jgi:hypothetical protein
MPPAVAVASAPARGGGRSSLNSTQQQQPQQQQHASNSSSQTQRVRGQLTRNTTPSYYSLEKPFISDTTGPIHVSLRGSRPVVYPRSAVVSVGTASNPNHRETGEHVFRHAPTVTRKEWMGGDRTDVMQSHTKVSFTHHSPSSIKSVAEGTKAGKGGRLERAKKDSEAWKPKPEDLHVGLTPLQQLAAARGADLLAVAEALQKKSAQRQAEADAIFERSAKARYERAAQEYTKPIESLTSPFFLQPTGHVTKERKSAEAVREKLHHPNTPASVAYSSAGHLAGLSSLRYKSWDGDNKLKLVARAAAREKDNFSATFERVLSDDSESKMADCRSTTKDALEAGRSTQGVEGGFVPHFLAKVHPSLHGNNRRAVYNNGNTFFDAITPTSKFKQQKFIPRAYGTSDGRLIEPTTSGASSAPAEASAAAPVAAAPVAASSSAGEGGSGFVGM